MFTRISSATLMQLVKLSQRKEVLMAQIQEIDREMTRIGRKYKHAPITVSTVRKKKRTRRRS
jgi:hypothetical protein